MRDALLLTAALAANTAGLAWFAMAKDVHWHQVRGEPHPPAAVVRLLRALGAAGLAGSLMLCLAVDHGSMAALVWVMALAAGALIVTFTLAWRPRGLRWLALGVGNRASA